MANFRQIHVSIWKDGWFSDLEPDEKLLFVYLFSNESTSLSGIYRITKKFIAFETGIDKKRIDTILSKFEKDGKVFYERDIVWIVNMRKFHATKSIKVQTRITSDIGMIPDTEIKNKYIAYNKLNIPYRYPIDTGTQLKEDEEEKEEEYIPSSGLEAAFVEASQLQGLSPSPEKAFKAYAAMEKAGVERRDVIEAVRILLKKDYTIVGPSSIVNTAITQAAKRKAVDSIPIRPDKSLEGYTPA